MKDYGVDRTVESGSVEYNARMAEVQAMLASGLYSSVEMSKDGGGYVAIEKGKAKHKKEEIEAAHYMADAGYKVVLKDETGQTTTPDGYVFNYSFEQRTPNPKGDRPLRREIGVQSVKKALDHGAEKARKGANIDVAVIYDKYHSYDHNVVEAGIRRYEQYNNRNRMFRFKRIIVISKSGKVYEHYHNDIQKPPT